jgi:hypothetical protein
MPSRTAETRAAGQPVNGAADIPQRVRVEPAFLAPDGTNSGKEGAPIDGAVRRGSGALRIERVFRAKVAAGDGPFDPARRHLVALVCRDGSLDRRLESEQLARHQFAQARITRDEVVFEALDKALAMPIGTVVTNRSQ